MMSDWGKGRVMLEKGSCNDDLSRKGSCNDDEQERVMMLEEKRELLMVEHPRAQPDVVAHLKRRVQCLNIAACNDKTKHPAPIGWVGMRGVDFCILACLVMYDSG